MRSLTYFIWNLFLCLLEVGEGKKAMQYSIVQYCVFLCLFFYLSPHCFKYRYADDIMQSEKHWGGRAVQ